MTGHKPYTKLKLLTRSLLYNSEIETPAPRAVTNDAPVLCWKEKPINTERDIKLFG